MPENTERNTNNSHAEQALPKALTGMVRWAVALLGDTIRAEYGDEVFQEVESIRRQTRELRRADDEKLYLAMEEFYARAEKYDARTRYQIAHSFALMMELINRCENAYRTYRLSQSAEQTPANVVPEKVRIIFVLTAHPTEARSPECVGLFEEIQKCLIQNLQEADSECRERLGFFLRLALKIPMARESKPTVEDEAAYLYSLLLRDSILAQLLRYQSGFPQVYIRSWVGGDKDGHPGVDARTFRNSLRLSRSYLVDFMVERLRCVQKDLSWLAGSSASADLDRKYRGHTAHLNSDLEQLREIRAGDGGEVRGFQERFQDFCQELSDDFGTLPQEVSEMVALLRLFPGLVVPLEMREDSSLVAAALQSEKSDSAITQMLAALREVASGGYAQWYARALVLSMVESYDDFRNGIRLVARELTENPLPVVPLFETRKALEEASEILEEALQEPQLTRQVRETFKNRFEVMLGYSDSAKESGSLPSRLLIFSAMHEMEEVLKRHGVQPIFFHGSGGSVARGGGSLSEQISWWPESALRFFKATIQGEMVQRTFASPEILESQVSKIYEKLIDVQGARPGHREELPKALVDFAQKVQDIYARQVSDPEFLKVVELATPYQYLHLLKMGSRPTKRKSGQLSLQSLRAIPWILCWTQTRVLFVAWWGVGAAWTQMSPTEKNDLRDAFQQRDIFSSFVKLLAFTLAKVELGVWKFYLRHSDLSEERQDSVYQEMRDEFDKCIAFVKEVSGESELLWFRPWLQESIHLRSPSIHPLNVLQLVALESEDQQLLSETVTGVSSGMLTTG